MYSSLNRNANPTDGQRHEMLKNALENAGRPEDYEFITRLLGPAPDITNIAEPGELRGVKIGIIGGGLAGLSAAYELRKTGADITIFEASNERVGGRVHTFYFDSEGKYYGELGALQIPIAHETTWHYINLFGLNTQPIASPGRNNFLYVHNTRLRTSGSIEQFLYPKYELTQQETDTPWNTLKEYADTCRLLQLRPEVRAELIRILPEYSPDLVPLMEMSLRENYEGLGLSQGAISLISGVDPVSGALLYVSFDEIAQQVYTLDFLETYRLQDGNINLPLAFLHSFCSDNSPGYTGIPQAALGNVTCKTGHCVTGIYQSDYRSKVVLKYTNKSESGDTADIFDYIICTIPLTALRTIEVKPCFNNMKMQGISEINYVDAMKALLLCNRRFWERNTEYGNILGGISVTDLPVQSIFYPADYNSSEKASRSFDYPGVLTASLTQNSISLGCMEGNSRYEVIRQNLEEVHGLPRGFLTPFIEGCQTAHWNSEPLFRGAFNLNLPGQKRLFAYELQQPEYNGRLYFAGEHVSNKHGWMQGALASGREAANRLAQHFHGQF